MATAISLLSTPFFKAYPWSSEVVFTQDRLAFIEKSLQNTSRSSEVKEFIKILARQVGTTNIVHIHDKITRELVTELMGPGGAEWDNAGKAQALIQLASPSPRSHEKLLHMGNIVFKYRLLDVFAKLLASETGGLRPIVPRAPRPESPTRKLVQVYESLGNWPKIVSDFCQLHKKALPESTSEGPPFESNTLSGIQKQFVAGISCLAAACGHGESAKYNKILANIMVLASCLWWFGMGYEELPADKDALIDCLQNHAMSIGLSLEQLGPLPELPELPSTVAQMRNALHMALAFSPLLALIPKKLATDGVRRDHMLAHAISLGNDKPVDLVLIEGQLWEVLAQIAAGSDVGDRLRGFSDEAQKALHGIQEGVIRPSWFVERPTENTASTSSTTGIWFLGGPTEVISSTTGGSNRDNSTKGKGKTVTMDASDEKKQVDNKTTVMTDASDEKKQVDNKTTGKGKAKTGKERKGKKTPRLSPVVSDEDELSQEEGQPVPRRCLPKRNRPSPQARREFDLPIVSIPPIPKQSAIPLVKEVLDESPTEDGVEVTLFLALPKDEPLRYEYKGWGRTLKAEAEHRLLKETMENVEQGYYEGCPPHHLPEAHDHHYTDQRSRIFITSSSSFRELSARDIQEIFRFRHILLTGADAPNSRFDRYALSRLGSLETMRVIHANSLKDETSTHLGSLQDLLPGSDGRPVRGIRVLHIPMGGSNVAKPPLYSKLASNEEAWQEAREEKGINSGLTFPSDQVVWARASTRDSISPMQLDGNGFATSINVVTGRIYCVLASSRRDPNGTIMKGDLGSIKAFKDFSSDVCQSQWEFEGVLLCPGDVLYMAPNTPHFILTVDDAIVHGRYMYSASTSQMTSIGFIHTFVNGYQITSEIHDLLTFLRREMAMWLRRYKENPFFDRSEHPHVPDVYTAAGLMDVMAVGNMLELATAIDRRCYLASSLTLKEREEMGTVRSLYRQLQLVIGRSYVIKVDGMPIHPLLVFRRSLVEFGAALVVYKETMGEELVRSKTCTVDKVKEKTASYFQANYPNLLPRLQELIDARFEFLYWTGPKLSISRRTDDHRFFSRDRMNSPAMTKQRPLRDFIDAPLYSSVSYSLTDKENGESPKAELDGSVVRGTTDVSPSGPQRKDSTVGSALAASNFREGDDIPGEEGGSDVDSPDPFCASFHKQRAGAIHFPQVDDDGDDHDNGLGNKKGQAQLDSENSGTVRGSSKFGQSYSQKQWDGLDVMDVDSQWEGGDGNDAPSVIPSSPVSNPAGSVESQREVEAAVNEQNVPARNLRRGPRQVRDSKTGLFRSQPQLDDTDKEGPSKQKPPAAKSKKGKGGGGKGSKSKSPLEPPNNPSGKPWTQKQSGKGKKRVAEAPMEPSKGAKRRKA